ncbi:MAG: type II toxin-antitoxin system HipA family toxin [Myxococcota bacterium]
MRSLDVYWDQERVGRLSEQAERRWSFRYDADYKGLSISASLPKAQEEASGLVVFAYFTNLLPEAAIRTQIARHLGQSAEDDFGLLEALGGEIAGALTLLPAGEVPPAPSEQVYRQLTQAELLRFVREPTEAISRWAEGSVRLSLAGAQSKLPVVAEDGKLWLPESTEPTTHLLKFASPSFKRLPENEAFCLRLARNAGLEVVSAELVADGQAVLIERFDRMTDADGWVHRLHQEDACQALGLPSTRKYQEEGGPGLEDLFGLIDRIVQTPALDRQKALRLLAFNLAIGNADAHGKNFSFLRDSEGVRLAPGYDLVSTAHYKGIDRRLAMRLAEVSDPDRIKKDTWLAVARELGFQPRYLAQELTNTLEMVESALKRTLEEMPVKSQDICRVLGREVRKRIGLRIKAL